MRPPDHWRQARATLTIAIATFVAWLLAATTDLGNEAALLGGFIPARVGVADMLPAVLLTPLTATFVHAGIAHLGFNLLMLLFCGRSVETIVGMRGFVLLYVVGAYVAAAGQWAWEPDSPVPMIGASGAISAVIGAYAMLFGRNRVRVTNLRAAVWLNALWLAAAWIGLQLLVGLTFETAGARIAIFAHIGGFLAGLLLARPLLLLRYRGA